MLHLGNATAAMSARPKPHVVFVLMDDWGSFDAGWRQTEAGRAPLLRTPRLDALARAGARLDNYYVQHICSPTRSALLSARLLSLFEVVAPPVKRHERLAVE